MPRVWGVGETVSNEPVILEARRLVETRTFIKGAQDHVDGLAGYVRGFLRKNEGLLNEHGRAWSVESCADALKIPSGTLHRWMGSDQGVSAPVITPQTNRERVARSNTRAVLADENQRRAVISSLPPELRDELKADLIDLDLPGARTMRHGRCSHCPEWEEN